MSEPITQVVRGRLLVPRADGTVDYFPDGALAADQAGVLQHAGPYHEISAMLPSSSSPLAGEAGRGASPGRESATAAAPLDPSPDPSRGGRRVAIRRSTGVLLPPLVDIHIHIPQHPIRGHFVDGVPDDAPHGKLLAGLQKNVFPAEAKCYDVAIAKQVVDAFARDTLRHGVVGGCAYMMVSPRATDVALSTLPDTWSVGMVLMNQNSPEYLVTNEPSVERDIEALARKFGRRCVVTDRFAVAVDSTLRRRASALAAKLGLRTQTHLNEQASEKRFVENELYPDARSYTDVYLDDGLLDHACILAHCIHMTDDEWRIVRDTQSVIAHCPTSNLLLGSGTMSLEAVHAHGIPYAIATDVGASPTVSMLAEMGRFLDVHAGRSTRATPAEALYRATRAPAEILGIAGRVGVLEVGRPMSFLEVQSDEGGAHATADQVIRSLIPTDLDAPEPAVNRVTLAGRIAYDRDDAALV